MKKHNSIKKLGRTRSHRDATMQNLASALFTHKRIKTTLAKAKAMRSYVEKTITVAKRGTGHAYRNVSKKIRSKQAIKILFEEVVEKVADRTSGYTRVIKLPPRLGDSAKLAYIELVDYGSERVQKKSVKQDRTKRVKGSKEAESMQLKETDTKQTTTELNVKEAESKPEVTKEKNVTEGDEEDKASKS